RAASERRRDCWPLPADYGHRRELPSGVRCRPTSQLAAEDCPPLVPDAADLAHLSLRVDVVVEDRRVDDARVAAAAHLLVDRRGQGGGDAEAAGVLAHAD